LYNKKKSGEPEVKQPEKIKTALKNTNETTYKPEILASSKKIDPIVSPNDIKLDVIEEEGDTKTNNYALNQSIDDEPIHGSERDADTKNSELEKPFLNGGSQSQDIIKNIQDRNVDLL